ncbi:MAG TPA: sulfate/molybdate ABC transporter ATP-binding protein [Candidatus Acidoferrum sp.]|nr:sulfate/molybdate ABC transporter ATP-binding protein [Candidatus Acidoferrum sp.]
MPLEIEFQKSLREFTLDVSFHGGDEPLAVLGPSGSGKTMLLRVIAGLERPDRGRIALNGRVVFDAARHIHVPARERRVGVLFQHYALFPHRTARENIAFGLHQLALAEREARVKELAQRVHVTGLESRFPGELSGGEQQRVALARALAIQPEALLLDEALTALDTHLRSQVEQQLQETLDTFDGPALLVTHNIEEAYRLGRKLLVLTRGKIAAFGDKEEIFRHPPSVEVARLTGCKNFSRARAISSTEIEALDWGCRLRVPDVSGKTVNHVGIRAHHLDFVEAHDRTGANENVFPCWLARSSETPFRITLFLHLQTPPTSTTPPHLQAEVFKEKWARFRNSPLPWHIRLSPESLLLFPD